MRESFDQNTELSRRILYVQKPEILPAQVEQVQAFLTDNLSDVTVEYASRPEDVPWGVRMTP